MSRISDIRKGMSNVAIRIGLKGRYHARYRARFARYFEGRKRKGEGACNSLIPIPTASRPNRDSYRNSFVGHVHTGIKGG